CARGEEGGTSFDNW
nr:immunoglobulin heavy chain junction region [Macaca mulatta]MOV90298.1 immunoglobulin heavy chain junction region [Macaca mulatta]